MLDRQTFRTVVESTPLVSIDLIAKSQNTILLGKRVNKPAKGYFFTTGGIVRKNESFKDAIKRLAQAELGIKLHDEPKYIGVFEHFYEDGVFEGVSTHYVNHGYIVELDNKLTSIPKDQHSEYRWFEIEELLKSDEVHHYVKDYFKDRSI